MHLQSNILQLMMPDLESSLWTQRLGHTDSTPQAGSCRQVDMRVPGERTGLERTASNNVRGSRLCTHPCPTARPHRGGEPAECPDAAPNPALSMVLQERPCPIGEGTPLPPPQLLPPVVRTESLTGTITNAQQPSTASKSNFKHIDVNTQMSIKNQVKKQVDHPQRQYTKGFIYEKQKRQELLSASQGTVQAPLAFLCVCRLNCTAQKEC